MILDEARLAKLNKETFEFDPVYTKEDIKDVYLRRLEDIHAEITLKRNIEDDFEGTARITGTMICPCAITNVDVPVEIDIDDEILLSETNENAIIYKNTLNLNDLVYNLIANEIPLKVVKDGEIDYPKGEGWEVISEDAYNKSKQNSIDPRWEKLMEYKED